jgi:hypothetical protein
VADWKQGEGQQLLGAVAQHALELGGLAAQDPSDHLELLADVGGVGLGEAGADGGGDHLRGALGHAGEYAAEEVDPAALDCRASHHGLDGLAEAEVGVGDHQLHPSQPAGLQAAQELGPEGAVLAVTDGEAEHLPTAVAAHPGRHHHGLGDHPAVDPGLAGGGVDEDIGEHLAGQRRE